MRRVTLATLLVGGLASCNRAPATNTPGEAAEAAPVETTEEPAPPEATKSPSQILSALHFCEVEVDDSISMPDGFIVAYHYGRIDSWMGELRKDGIDVQAEIDEETAKCEAEREQMEEEEREWIEMEGRTCDEEALTSVLDDEEASTECKDFGLAYFDLGGALLYDQDGPGECLSSSQVDIELKTMPGSEAPILMVTSEHGTYGHYTRGGWGFVRERGILQIMRPRDGELFFDVLVDAVLHEEEDGGNCSSGVHAGYEFSEEGHLDVYRQEWDDCEHEECLMELEEGDSEDYDESECEPPIEVERAEWSPADGGEFTDFEEKDEEDPVIPGNVR